jgi:hypothetical protein
MSDGLDEYHHSPMAWAVGTVLEGNVDHKGLTARELVDSVWEFIVACFHQEDLPLPDKKVLIERVAERLREE